MWRPVLISMLVEMTTTLRTEFLSNGFLTRPISEFFHSVRRHSYLTYSDIGAVLLSGLLLTLLRFLLVSCVFRPITRYLVLSPLQARKFCESSWKFLFYTVSWIFCAKLVIYGKDDLLNNPEVLFSDWFPGLPVPNDVYLLYIVECGFYFHSIYATLYLDHWRRDSVLMIFHHVLTISLILFSLSVRYYKMGLLVLFTHDNADILLEASKIVLEITRRKGMPPSWEIAPSSGFLLFASTWCYFRLYLYFKVVLYNAGHTARHVAPNGPFYLSFNFMLWCLYGMNIWWFRYIMMVALRRIFGAKPLDDVREEESQPTDRLKSTMGKKLGPRDRNKTNGDHAKALSGDAYHRHQRPQLEH